LYSFDVYFYELFTHFTHSNEFVMHDCEGKQCNLAFMSQRRRLFVISLFDK